MRSAEPYRPGTVITFGPGDHRGFKGADYLVIRRAEGGRSLLEGTAPLPTSL